MMIRRWMGATMMVMAGVAVACDEDPVHPADDGVVPTEQLTFVRFAPGVLPGPVDTSFWAFRGTETRLRLRPAGSEPGEEGEAYFEFELEEESLLRYPDGTLFQNGDSVLIHVSMPNDSQFVFIFEPSGLVFNPDEPAELKLDWDFADGDLNGDGEDDQEDDDYETELALWKQEAPGDPWQQLATLKLEDLNEAEAEIGGFTGFALAGQ